MSASVIMALLSVCLVLVAAFLAYLDGMLLPSHMMERRRYTLGFPFVANGAVWGNLILLSPALYIIGKYESGWSDGAMSLAFSVGMGASWAMFQFVYLQGKFPDSLAGRGRVSPAGFVMLLYSGAVVAAIGLFYLFSHPTPEDVIRVGILLALYIIVANHVPLDFLNKQYFFPWCPDIFAEEKTPLLIIIGSGALLATATAFKLW